jgi:hypothetical protein
MENENESGVSSGQTPGFVTLNQHEALIDRLDRVLPIIEALGELVVEAD